MAPGNRYPPLTKGPEQSTIRIVTLEPGQSGEDIVCHLQVASLPEPEIQDDAVFYDALSYAFGPETPTRSITLDAWTVVVRKNLWHCLHQIRHPTRQTSLWVDSLSINMHDAEEHASQVSMMDKIYRGARQVLVWLGTGDGDSTMAMRMIREAATPVPERTERDESDYRALLSWSRRPYWNRTW